MANLPRETITKLFYCKPLDAYVTVPGTSLFKVARCAWVQSRKTALRIRTVALPLSITSN